VAGREGSANHARFSFQCLENQTLEAGDFSLRKLRSTTTKPGLMDLILTKRAIKDFLLGRFLDVRNIHSDYKQAIREVHATVQSFDAKLKGDMTLFSTWPVSATKVVDLIETTCFSIVAHDDATIKTGIKSGKAAQEIVEEYQPWKTQIEEIDAALRTENSVMKVDDGSTAIVASTAGAAATASAATASNSSGADSKGAAAASAAVGITISSVEDKWLDYAKRHISKFCVLIVEANKTQTQIATAIQAVSLGTVKGGSAGNVIISFDCNLFGESITAPHVRKAPVQPTIATKMWKAVQSARAQPDQIGILPIGDVLIVIDGGRKTDMFVNMFGMGKDRRSADKTRKQRDGAL
jgi:hypothetical protein